ncbi:hypothetical protein EVG20_g9102 [Dentipellis fragilis]|uniref:Uncharacterized protein n=1 Tax=Dentipellis fragilis TaxID=205917 RepID=A0A4Y9Y0Q1_9AGAM|nr:hypothetical protein EVG20_g9102 [Dentipellis fragilis]
MTLREAQNAAVVSRNIQAFDDLVQDLVLQQLPLVVGKRRRLGGVLRSVGNRLPDASKNAHDCGVRSGKGLSLEKEARKGGREVLT